MFPSPIDVINEMPLSSAQAKFVSVSRNTLEKILSGKDQRLVLIVGPCSIHDEKATYEYAEKLKALADTVSEQFFIVMRTYFEKPRTKKGWKGLIYDPNLDDSNDVEKGVRLARKILLNLTDLGMPAGAELLELSTSHYFADLLSWGCIGARTSSSQPHRELASSFTFPIGFKNTIEGNIDPAVNGILAASSPHVFLGTSKEGHLDRIETVGNGLCHLVLRGGCEAPNYDTFSLQSALDKCDKHEIIKKVLVDCSHGNSQKKESLQISAFESVLNQYLEGNRGILGMMLESHLFGGFQTVKFPLKYGVSVTDGCLDWPSTREIILKASEALLNIDYCLSQSL